MTFTKYVKDKRYFLVFFLCIMLFVSVAIIVSSAQIPVANIVYILVSCSLFAGGYIVIGYYYRKKFYMALIELTESGYEGIGGMLPHAQNDQQTLFLHLLQKVMKDFDNQLQKLFDEKRDQQQFIMTWIHEVKLPIAASRLLIENSEGKSTELLVDKFEDEIDKIDHYVEQALYHTRSDSFANDYFITEIQVKQLVNKSVKKFAKWFITKRIQFAMEVQDQLVHSDSKWLGYVVDQIMVNSLKYTMEGGKIVVRYEEDRREKRLFVQDNGIGIASEDLDRVFEKGFTGSTGRSHANSTGIGLYLAQQLAVKLGHSITIESEEREYTVVTIHFPKIRQYFDLDDGEANE